MKNESLIETDNSIATWPYNGTYKLNYVIQFSSFSDKFMFAFKQ